MREVIEKPASLTGERWDDIKDEADGLDGSMGFQAFRGYNLTNEEDNWLWNEYIYGELGLDACSCCGIYDSDPSTFCEEGYCEQCYEHNREYEEEMNEAD